MEESDPEYQAEMAKLKENARKEKLRQKALKDFKAQQREERVREGVEAVKTYRKGNHIPAKRWLPWMIISLVMIFAGVTAEDPSKGSVYLRTGFVGLFVTVLMQCRASLKEKIAREHESQLSELEARGQADRKKASEPKGGS